VPILIAARLYTIDLKRKEGIKEDREKMNTLIFQVLMPSYLLAIHILAVGSLLPREGKTV
jgi:hypothetical protein